MRFSSPITTSRLRSPMSASISTTLMPSCAIAAPRLAVVVVLPTPPLPDVMTIARPMLSPTCSRQGRSEVVQETARPRWTARAVRIAGTGDPAPDPQLLWLQRQREDAPRIAADRRVGHSAQPPQHDDAALGAHLGAGVHVAD